uniref:Superoxide dismutase n=2 Tax=Tenebrioninae TaxID=1272141 RepID=A0A076G2Z1_TENMO|nr:manganese superoxide dismutase [Tenebrio molitor]
MHTLPDLPYDYDALEPVISSEIMKIHHAKHHKAYVDNLNKAEEGLQKALSEKDVSSQIAFHNALKFNGGGHLNHSIFWNNLAPKSRGGGYLNNGQLKTQIEKQFSSFAKFKEVFSSQAVAIKGSGWAWLGYDTRTKNLALATCQNQDPLLATVGLIPLLGVDVWEHAYYLQYKNERPKYVDAIWEIVNWKNVEESYQKAVEFSN